MKDIKSYVIGFLTCACMFLIMGQTDGEEMMEWNVDGKVIIESNENGRYQATSTPSSYLNDPHIYTTIFDTRTGEILDSYKNKKKNYKNIKN